MQAPHSAAPSPGPAVQLHLDARLFTAASSWSKTLNYSRREMLIPSDKNNFQHCEMEKLRSFHLLQSLTGKIFQQNSMEKLWLFSVKRTKLPMKSHSALNKFSGHSRAVLDKPDCSVLSQRERHLRTWVGKSVERLRGVLKADLSSVAPSQHLTAWVSRLTHLLLKTPRLWNWG